jgi:hypothetical protein
LTAVHRLFPEAYPEKTSPEILSVYSVLLTDQGLPIAPDALQGFLAEDGAIASDGRGLYPSYLSPDQGETNWWYLALAPRDYARLAFQIVGPDKLGIIGPDEVGAVLPLDTEPDYFPDGADVIVFGCLVDNEYDEKLPGYIDALLVVVKSSQLRFYQRVPVPELKCPLPER